MKTMQADLSRHLLERRIAPLRSLALEVPPRGWIKAIRECLGMTMRQLGARMGVTPSRIARIERDELRGATTVKMLRETAAAMNCTLVYAFIPNPSLDEILLQRAKQRQQPGVPARSAFIPLRGLWDDFG